jgi:hypothetical protein
LAWPNSSIDDWHVSEERSEDGLQVFLNYVGNPVVRVRMLTFERWQGFPPFEVSVLDFFDNGSSMTLYEKPMETATDWPSALQKGREVLRRLWEEKLVKDAERRLGAP